MTAANITPMSLDTGVILTAVKITPVSKEVVCTLPFSDDLLDCEDDEIAFTSSQSKCLYLCFDLPAAEFNSENMRSARKSRLWWSPTAA